MEARESICMHACKNPNQAEVDGKKNAIGSPLYFNLLIRFSFVVINVVFVFYLLGYFFIQLIS
jgi:hypothetical protein